MDITLLTGQVLDVPIEMKVGSVAESVTVTAEAPVLNTADSRTQLTIETQELANLPLQGRNLLALTTVAPGVTGLGLAPGGSPGSAPDNFSTETQVDASANGRGSVGNMFVVDGMDVTSDIRPGVLNLTPNPDAIQEASIQTNTFSTEFGRASSLQMVMTTKSGGSAFHGTASDYFTYQNLWALTEFASPRKYSPFHSNNFSGSIGGPILPKHQFFFFFSAEPLRSTMSTAASTQTFEDAQFTAWAQQNFPNTLGSSILATDKPSGATVTGVAKTAADVFPTTCGTAATSNLPCALYAHPGRKLDSNYSLNTVDICPVGALTDTDFRFKMRVWFLKETKSICTSCATGCNTIIGTRENVIYRQTPRENNSVNSSWMCDYGRHNFHYVNSPERLTKPRVRLGSAQEDASWTTAIARAVDDLRRFKGDEIAVIASGRMTNEELWLTKQLIEALGIKHHDIVPRVGESDEILLSSYRNPNIVGAHLLGVAQDENREACCRRFFGECKRAASRTLEIRSHVRNRANVLVHHNHQKQRHRGNRKSWPQEPFPPWFRLVIRRSRSSGNTLGTENIPSRYQ